MHVLPLPFGLALALLPRREAQAFRPRVIPAWRLKNPVNHRDRVLGDVRHFSSRRFGI
jgi:hypothetical protein